jgi:hypothetical protein
MHGQMKKRILYKTTLLKIGISRQHVLQIWFTEFQKALQNGLRNKG